MGDLFSLAAMEAEGRRRQMLRMLTQGRPHVLAFEAAKTALSVQVRMALERRGAKGSTH